MPETVLEYGVKFILCFSDLSITLSKYLCVKCLCITPVCTFHFIVFLSCKLITYSICNFVLSSIHSMVSFLLRVWYPHPRLRLSKHGIFAQIGCNGDETNNRTLFWKNFVHSNSKTIRNSRTICQS